jgi:hypothetical protein
VTVLEFFFCDMDYMGVFYYCLWSLICPYLLRCECSVDIDEYFVVFNGHILSCMCNLICKLENIRER